MLGLPARNIQFQTVDQLKLEAKEACEACREEVAVEAEPWT